MGGNEGIYSRRLYPKQCLFLSLYAHHATEIFLGYAARGSHIPLDLGVAYCTQSLRRRRESLYYFDASRSQLNRHRPMVLGDTKCE